jgi:hypothetical protein
MLGLLRFTKVLGTWCRYVMLVIKTVLCVKVFFSYKEDTEGIGKVIGKVLEIYWLLSYMID